MFFTTKTANSILWTATMDWKYSSRKYSSRSASVQNVQAVQAV
jgi:hypothetical protein